MKIRNTRKSRPNDSLCANDRNSYVRRERCFIWARSIFHIQVVRALTSIRPSMRSFRTILIFGNNERQNKNRLLPSMSLVWKIESRISPMRLWHREYIQLTQIAYWTADFDSEANQREKIFAENLGHELMSAFFFFCCAKTNVDEMNKQIFTRITVKRTSYLSDQRKFIIIPDLTYHFICFLFLFST